MRIDESSWIMTAVLATTVGAGAVGCMKYRIGEPPTGQESSADASRDDGGASTDAVFDAGVSTDAVVDAGVSTDAVVDAGATIAACGSSACAADEFCEIVVSDIPEFDGSYYRYQCRPLPDCDHGTICACLESTERCQYLFTEFHGSCVEPSGDGRPSLTCSIGG